MNPGPTIPRATYRLQFHRGFTLRDALALVPYLDALGVSHLYASPLLEARPGSTHGYDVCDPSRINLEVGTEEDLQTLVTALRKRGMGLVLDIVPNHMAAAPENPWWWDVLKHGRHSRFADYFDIDWDSSDARLRDKVFLPVLGDTLDRVLERGELKIEFHDAEATIRYLEHRFPVDPQSILALGPRLEDTVAKGNSDRKTLGPLLERQHYRLAFWRLGDSQLNYRRFFNFTHLAGVRVEQPQVFADSHLRILHWHRDGLLDGLRVDHPDGLRDPQDYLQRLTAAAPGAWIVVEKILEPGEDFPADWPVAGTTGYDFLGRVGGLFIDPAGEKPLTDFYAEFTGEPTDWASLRREKKRWILSRHFVAEVDRLVRLLATVLANHQPGCAVDPDGLREAIVELIACFPVYRTYIQAEKRVASAIDKTRVSQAAALALESRPRLSPSVLAFVRDLLHLRISGDSESEFVMRFQQLTGPAMAKGVEDTACYCFNRFVALNEVGDDPARFGLGVEEFHGAHTLQLRPNAMLATTTHDTNRSEDVRARLALLSEIPKPWTDTVRRWSARNEKLRRNDWPDRNAESLFYQTLVGAWPLTLDRALAYMEKAVREAKQHTDWSDPNPAYEDALKQFVTAALDDRDFVQEVERFVAPLAGAGYLNSLAQTLLKLTCPGVPDLYQGAEFWDFSLVDPDNRRPVDFAPRLDALDRLRRGLSDAKVSELVDALLHNPADGRLKLFVIHQTLRCRRSLERLFRDGRYMPLSATGMRAKHVCAFARTLENTTAVTVVPRLVLGLGADRPGFPMGEEIWKDTRLIFPPALGDGSFRNAFTGEILPPRKDGSKVSLHLAEVLGKFPVALLEPLETHAITGA